MKMTMKDVLAECDKLKARVAELEANNAEQKATIHTMELGYTGATEEIDRLTDQLATEVEQRANVEAALTTARSAVETLAKVSLELIKSARVWKHRATVRKTKIDTLRARIATLRTQRNLLGGLTLAAMTGKPNSTTRRLSR